MIFIVPDRVAMTPAIKVLEKAGVSHVVRPYEHDPAAQSFGLEAAEKLGLPPQQVFKTLIAELDTGKLVVAVVPVTMMLDLKALAAAAGGKRAAMASVDAAERATGYVHGGISPLGQKKRLPLLLDASAATFAVIYVSGGRRGLDIELAPEDLLRLSGGRFAELAR